ncbi:glycosyltransferase family 4 protein [Paraburkholderia tropica]|uniref:glycosyltransferase family 4 protein n=1 Tax=Paraburkholderia tropica TaxID=92647 RepID=UPI002AAF4DC1|nr:glycosyltransferase family 4 protein [Paraburkholderia tropica]
MSKPLTIVMVHQGAELYGSDRSFLSALAALRERHPDALIDVVLPEPGPLVDLVARYASRIQYDENGVLRKKKLKARPFRTLKDMAFSWQRFRRMFANYDICYVNTVVCVAAIMALRLRQRGGYVHVREIPSKLALRVFNAMLKLSHASLIYNSNATAGAFGLPGTVIHNGVEVRGDVTSAEPRSVRPLRLAIIGRINPWKGQQFVLDALATLGRALPVEIRIVGAVFPGYEALLSQLQHAAANCAQRVEISGFTDDPSVHYQWADFALVPSTLPEPFGRVAVESFAMKRPVIAAAHGGLQEIVVDGVNGFLFQPADDRDFVRTLERAVATRATEYVAMAEAARQAYLDSFTERSYMNAIVNCITPDDGQKPMPDQAPVASTATGIPQ